MRGLKSTLAIVAVLLLAVLAVFLVACDRGGFTGERVKNPDSYTLDIQRMNGADRHTMELTAGDVLQVTFKTDSGSLHMEITSPEGDVLYAGNGEETTDFEINVRKSGVYAITVEARHAKGTIHVCRKEVTP